MAYSATGLAFGGRPRGRRGRLGLSLSALTSSDSASVVASVGATVSSTAAFALLAAFDGAGSFAAGASATVSSVAFPLQEQLQVVPLQLTD